MGRSILLLSLMALFAASQRSDARAVSAGDSLARERYVEFLSTAASTNISFAISGNADPSVSYQWELWNTSDITMSITGGLSQFSSISILPQSCIVLRATGSSTYTNWSLVARQPSVANGAMQEMIAARVTVSQIATAAVNTVVHWDEFISAPEVTYSSSTDEWSIPPGKYFMSLSFREAGAGYSTQAITYAMLKCNATLAILQTDSDVGVASATSWTGAITNSSATNVWRIYYNNATRNATLFGTSSLDFQIPTQFYLWKMQ